MGLGRLGRGVLAPPTEGQLSTLSACLEVAWKSRCGPRPADLRAGPLWVPGCVGCSLCHRRVPPACSLTPSAQEWNKSGPLPVPSEPHPSAQGPSAAGRVWTAGQEGAGPSSLGQTVPLSSRPQESVHLPGAPGAAEGPLAKAARGGRLGARRLGEPPPLLTTPAEGGQGLPQVEGPSPASPPPPRPIFLSLPPGIDGNSVPPGQQ